MKYKGSFAKVKKGKSSTFGFEAYEFDTLEDFAEACLGHAWVPAILKGGHRAGENVTKIFGWLRFDCDEEGEKETICATLSMHGLGYIASPSTSYDKKTKPHKWHINVPATGASNDIAQYKRQAIEALSELGITISDRRVTVSCVQNMNPYRSGTAVKKGLKIIEIVEGEVYEFPKPNKDLKYSSLSKVKYNRAGSKNAINVDISSVKGKVTTLRPSSGIRVKDVGWVTLGDLNLERGDMLGGLSCPVHNVNHKDGKGGDAGYAFATKNEHGDIWIHCSGAECEGKHYKLKQFEFGDSRLTNSHKLRESISMCMFRPEKNDTIITVDSGNIFKWPKAHLHLGDMEYSAVDFSPVDEKLLKKIEALRNASDGDTNKLANDIANVQMKYHNDQVRKILKDDKSLNDFLMRYPTEMEGNAIVHFPIQLYEDSVKEAVYIHIQTKRQFKGGVEFINAPYNDNITTMVDGYTKTLKVYSSPKIAFISQVPNIKYVKDYKKHNPFLDDILDMIMAQLFGAEKKRSYLWLHMPSNWGKSFLFDGVLKGLIYELSSDEIKSAVKGSPSGLNVDGIRNAFALFVDEFKGAVSELKNIAYSMSVTPKNMGKYTIDIGLKVFASAETVASLISSDGSMEEQFRNRFLVIKAKGELTTRKVYTEDKGEYLNAIKIYARQRMYDAEQKYIALGDVEGPRFADKLFSEIADKYTIKDVSKALDNELPKMFREWLDGVTIPYMELYKHALAKDKDGNIVIYNLEKAKEAFIDEYVEKSQRASVGHKRAVDIIGNKKRAKVEVLGKRLNVWKVTALSVK